MTVIMLWRECFQNIKFRMLVWLEIILLLLGCVGFFLPKVSMELFPGQSDISISPGTYMVTIKYSAQQEGNEFKIYDTQNETGTILFGAVPLSVGENEEHCQMWVLRKTNHMAVESVYCGSGTFEMEQVSVRGTNHASTLWLFCVSILASVINALWMIRIYDKQIGFDREQKWVGGILLTAFVLVCVPTMVNYNLWGDDWGFHLLRTEGLISGLKDGQFPVRIQGNWLRGYGYAVSVFYSDVFVIIPMLFRLIGFTVNMSCRLFLVVINAATLLIAYQCFKRIFGNRLVGCTGAVLYTLCAYRMHNLYMRAAMGEALAMVFLPVVFYGFYRIFTDEIHEASYRKNWLVLTLGLTGIIQCHVLTCEMLALAILILCIVLVRKVLRKETFFILVKTVCVTLLLNLWYLLPFADYMITGKFNVGHAETMAIKEVADYGLYLTHLLFAFYGQGTQGRIQDIGMHHTGAFSVGVALMIAFFAWLYLEWSGVFRKKAREQKDSFAFLGLGRICFGFTALFFLLSLDVFPWYEIQHLGGLAEMLTLSLQFPWRFLSLACLTSSVLACVVVTYMREQQKEGKKGIYLGWVALLIGTALVFQMYQSNMQLYTRGFARVHMKQGMGTIYVSNGEYLPYEAQIDQMICDRVVPGQGVTVVGYEKGQDTLKTLVTVRNTDDTESYVELPLLYYKGYRATDVETGEKLSATAGENSVVRVLLPAGYEGELKVCFESPWYWRVSEAMSLATVVYVITAGKRRSCREQVAVVEQ